MHASASQPVRIMDTDAFTSTSAAAANSDNSGSLLARLPHDIALRVLARLLPSDRKALRAACRAGRAAANLHAGALVLWERDLAAAAAARLPLRFPAASELVITLDGTSASTSSSGGGIAIVNGVASPGTSPPGGLLPRASVSPPTTTSQLPGRFAGSCTLRGGAGGPSVASAAEAAAAAIVQQCAPKSLRLSVLSGACGAGAADVAALLPDAASPRLARLWVRAPQMQEPALVAIGRLTGLESLSLASSAGITTCHLSRLAKLTALRMTVSAPLAPALAPLAALHQLRALHLRCISPCGSWGAALTPALRASAANLRRLRVNFASLEPADVAALAAAAPLLRELDLTSCRGLSAAAVRHAAALKSLTALRLEHTGLILAHAELRLLGAGCPRLAELSVDAIDLHQLRQEQEQAAAAAAAAAASVAIDAQFGVARSAGSLRAPLFAPEPGTEAALAAATAAAAAAAAAAAPPAVATGLPPLVAVHLHSTSSYLNLQTLLRSAPRLKELSLHHYVRWDEALDVISSLGRRLTALRISGCSGLTRRGFEQLAGMRRLRRLAIGNAWLSAERIAPLAEAAAVAAAAVEADGSGSDCISSDEMDDGSDDCSGSGSGNSDSDGHRRRQHHDDSKRCRRPPQRATPRRPRAQRIASLLLEHATGLDSVTMRVLSRLPGLRRLALRDCPDLTPLALSELAAAPRLARVDVVGCNYVLGSHARYVLCAARARMLQAVEAARRGGGDIDDGRGSSGEWRPPLLLDPARLREWPLVPGLIDVTCAMRSDGSSASGGLW